MDPNATLKEQLEIARVFLDGHDVVDVEGNALRLAELVEALDEWLSGGGFLPERWARDPLGMPR